LTCGCRPLDRVSSLVDAELPGGIASGPSSRPTAHAPAVGTVGWTTSPPQPRPSRAPMSPPGSIPASQRRLSLGLARPPWCGPDSDLLWHRGGAPRHRNPPDRHESDVSTRSHNGEPVAVCRLVRPRQSLIGHPVLLAPTRLAVVVRSVLVVDRWLLLCCLLELLQAPPVGLHRSLGRS
jgi:hypothetical protein